MKDLIKMKRREFLISSIAAASAAAVSSISTASAEEPMKVGEIGVEADLKNMKRVKQKLVAPPFLPEHDQVATGAPQIIEVEMVVKELELEIADGVFYQALTFEGSNPGPLIVAHVGDYIELTLKNPKENTMEHNIDFHASTGALGGGGLTHVSPGEEVVLRYKADRAGTFIYHCAPGGVMIPYHVVSGMNGAVLILPREGLKDKSGNPVKYDKSYYVGEQDWYVPRDKDGKFKRYKTPLASMGDVIATAAKLIPSHITYNGKVGALTGDNAMKAKVGDTVLFIHSQANRNTSVHLIGGHSDLFWPGGSFNDTPQTNRETWPVAAGEAIAWVYTFKQPGVYAYVNHNLIEAVQLGALGHVSVEGKWNNDLMEQVKKPGPIT